jgi:hypothetical protein
MKVRIITALFDIKRDTKGDGRGIEDYLNWFKETLKLKCNMTIYTEERFKSFVEENRKNINYDTDIIIQKLEEIPFYKWKNKIAELINSDYFKSKMRDLNRIECYLPEYNIIQYSKFGWLEQAIEKNEDDYFFWMDAGCSRFFGNFDTNSIWPDTNKLDINKFTIQGNSNYVNFFHNLNIEEYIWDNNCVLVGTLFGGGRQIIKKLNNDINDIFNFFITKNCINNEQFALAIFAKQNPDIMDTKILLDGTHLPLFNILK